jgi:hypothetical protein
LFEKLKEGGKISVFHEFSHKMLMFEETNSRDEFFSPAVLIGRRKKELRENISQIVLKNDQKASIMDFTILKIKKLTSRCLRIIQQCAVLIMQLNTRSSYL